MVGTEGYVQAAQYVVQVIACVFGADACLLLGVVFVEMGLHAHHPVLVVHPQGAAPGMVGPGDVYAAEALAYAYHD